MAYSDREVSEVSSTRIALDGKEVRECKSGHEIFERKRVFDRGRWAYAAGKVKLPRVSLLDPKDYSLSERRIGRSGRDRPKTNPLDIPMQDKLAFLRDVQKTLMVDPRLTIELFYSDSNLNVNLEGPEFDLEQQITRTALTLIATAKDGARITRGIDSDGQRAGWEFVKSFDSMLASERALRLLKAEKIRGGEYTVVLDPFMVGTLIHEALGHMAEGDSVAAGASALAGRIGQKIASPLVTIVDDGRDGYGSFFFDRDGTASQRAVLLENGVLKNFLNSRDSAGQLGMRSTGNCRGEFNCVRMTNTSMLPGKSALDEMLDIKKGVYLLGTTGGSTSPASSTFNFSAGEGFMIENGELTSNIGEATLTGDLFKVLGAVDLVGKDFVMNGGGCGKNGEMVPIGAGGVSLRTKAIIGGTA